MADGGVGLVAEGQEVVGVVLDEAARKERLAQVEEHVACENRHDLDAVMATFADAAAYDDTAWGEHHDGHQAVRGYYAHLMGAAPDVHIEIRDRHVADEAVVLECVISGTQTGTWRGLPATGRRFTFPLCAVYTFDASGRLAAERIFYDRATVLHQLGVLHEPTSPAGRLSTALTHPVTLGKAGLRQLRERLAERRSAGPRSAATTPDR